MRNLDQANVKFTSFGKFTVYFYLQLRICLQKNIWNES